MEKKNIKQDVIMVLLIVAVTVISILTIVFNLTWEF
jgi:hypothetical protein